MNIPKGSDILKATRTAKFTRGHWKFETMTWEDWLWAEQRAAELGQCKRFEGPYFTFRENVGWEINRANQSVPWDREGCAGWLAREIWIGRGRP